MMELKFKKSKEIQLRIKLINSYHSSQRLVSLILMIPFGIGTVGFFLLLGLTDFIENFLFKMIVVLIPTFLYGYVLLKYYSPLANKIEKDLAKRYFDLANRQSKVISKHNSLIGEIPILIEIKSQEVLIRGRTKSHFLIGSRIFSFNNHKDMTIINSVDDNTKITISILDNYFSIEMDEANQTFLLEEFDIISFIK